MRRILHTLTLTAIGLSLVLLTPTAADAQPGTYRVTITNLTQHQVLSPPVVATHAFDTGIFEVGEPVDMPFWLMAEDGIPTALAEELRANDRVGDVAAASEFLMPGHSLTLTVQSNPPFFRLSAVGMLVSTNDAFFGLDSYPLNIGAWLRQELVPAYDAGSEANNEDCAFIPGPPCGNAEVRAPGEAEGFVTIHPGLHGEGDLDPRMFGWHNPVAKITIQRVGG